MDVSLEAGDATVVGLRIRSDAEHWTDVGFDLSAKRMFVDRRHSGAEVAKDFPTRTEAPMLAGLPLTLQIVSDRSSIEVFAQNGAIAMTNLIFPPDSVEKVEILRDGGERQVRVRGRAWTLHSIWQR
jgi:sucrose-6-phosphate hydrolase SacC (GH32 family)